MSRKESQNENFNALRKKENTIKKKNKIKKERNIYALGHDQGSQQNF